MTCTRQAPRRTPARANSRRRARRRCLFSRWPGRPEQKVSRYLRVQAPQFRRKRRCVSIVGLKRLDPWAHRHSSSIFSLARVSSFLYIAPLMKLYVTGGAGYIGSICVEQLLDAGHEVTVFDNFSEGHRQAVEPRAHFVEGVLGVRQQVLKALTESKAEAVLHFAAHALVGESMTNPSKYFRNNVGSGSNLRDAMTATGVKRIIFSSTCATYGVPDRMPMTEDLPQIPPNPYGERKLMFE